MRILLIIILLLISLNSFGQFSIGPALYIGKSELSNDLFAQRSSQLDKIEYISIPLTMQFQYKKLNLNIGYQTSFLVSNYYKATTIDQVGTVSNSEGNGKEMFINRNISLISALSYNVYKNAHIEVRYTKGLTNENNGQTGLFYNATTTQFLIGLYYKIQFKKKELEKSKPS